MATLTLTQCATAAARFLGVLDSGESLSAQQLADALVAINALIDNWSSEQLMVPAVNVQPFTLFTGQQKYTIGPGANFNIARPVAIEAAALILIINGQTTQFPVEVLDAIKWSSIPDRGASANFVRFLFYDRASPTGNVYVSPVPLGGSIELTMWTPLTQFADATTAVTMLPAYTRALQLAAALELAPQYDVQPSEALTHSYQDAMARVRTLNAQLLGGIQPPAGQAAA